MTTAPPAMMLQLSGAPRVAYERHALDHLPEAVGRLSEALLAWPEGVLADGARLDEPRWPTMYDARLAVWSVEQLPTAHLAQDAALVALARDALDDPSRAEALAVATRCEGAFVIGAQLHGMSEDQLVSYNIIPRQHPDAEDAFWQGYRHGLDAEAIRARALTHQLLSACHEARMGWLAYHAHRRLPSLSAEASSQTAFIVASVWADPPRFWSAWLNVALALAHAPR